MKRVFGIVPIALILDTKLRPNDIRVYVALSSFAGRKNKCWPGVKKIAERSGVHPSHIPEHTKKLADLGYVVKVRRGKGISNVYYLADRISARERGVGMHTTPASYLQAEPAVGEHLETAVSDHAEVAPSNRNNNNDNTNKKNSNDNNNENNIGYDVNRIYKPSDWLKNGWRIG